MARRSVVLALVVILIKISDVVLKGNLQVCALITIYMPETSVQERARATARALDSAPLDHQFMSLPPKDKKGQRFAVLQLNLKQVTFSVFLSCGRSFLTPIKQRLQLFMKSVLLRGFKFRPVLN